MLQFLEPYIQKKIIVAEYLYLYGEDIPNELIQKLKISSVTLKKYLKEINELYKEKSLPNGMLYTSDALQKIFGKLLRESTQAMLLKMLILNPRKKADYYKEKLCVGSATFSRYIVRLNNSLAMFDVKLVSKSGYQLEYKDERTYLFLLTHLMYLYRGREEVLAEKVCKYCGTYAMDKINQLDFKDLLLFDAPFEQRFFSIYLQFALINRFQNEKRPSDHRIKRYLDALVADLEKAYSTDRKAIEDRWPLLTKEVFVQKLTEAERTSIKRMIVCTRFQISLFPYKLTFIPLRHYLIQRKFSIDYPASIQKIELYRNLFSDIFDVDLSYRQVVVTHFVLITDLIKYTEDTNKILYINSNLSHEHMVYVRSVIINILKSISLENFVQVELYAANIQYRLGKNDYIVTTKIVPTIDKTKQILVNDYIGLKEKVLLKKIFLRLFLD